MRISKQKRKNARKVNIISDVCSINVQLILIRLIQRQPILGQYIFIVIIFNYKLILTFVVYSQIYQDKCK